MSEISPPRHRGLMVSMFGIALAWGYTIASWLGVAFYFFPATGAQWRVPFALTAVPSVLILILIPWIPESPRWLIMKDRSDEAAKIVQALHGSGTDIQANHFANLEFQQMQEQIVFERQNHVTWWEFVTSKRYARRAWAAAFVFMTSQVSDPFVRQVIKDLWLTQNLILVRWHSCCCQL